MHKSKHSGFALLTFLPYIVMGLAALLALWKWADFKEDLREEGRTEVRAEWQAERASLIAARDAMVMRWAKAVQEVERVYVEKSVERSARFESIRSRSHSASVSGSIRLSPDAGRVLADASAAANAPGPAGEGQGAAPPVPQTAGDVDTTGQQWVTFAVEAAEAYADARDKWQACVSWASEIRNTNSNADSANPSTN